MTLKLSDRDVEKLLRQPDRPVTPPADLLARLRADLPAELDVAPTSGEQGKVLRPARWKRPLLSLAASLAVLIGGSTIAYRTFRQTAEPGSATATVGMTSPSADEESRFRDQATASQPEAPPQQEPSGEAAGPAAGALSRPAAGPQSDRTARSDAPRLEREPEAKKESPPPPAAIAVEETSAPDGISGGVVGGIAAPDPADADQEDNEPAVTAVVQEVAVESPEPLPAAVPGRLESPSVEANSAAAPPSQVEERVAAMKSKLPRLETPSTQDDLRWTGAARGAQPVAAPAPKADEVLLGAASAGDEAWRAVERALAEGRWPNGAEIAAARAAPLAPAASARPGGFASRQRAGGDSWGRLREETLEFLSREEKSRSGLAELRRRALRQIEREPEDPRGAELLRILNLVSGKLVA